MRSEDIEEFHVVSAGRWIDFFRKIPLPVLAVGNKEIYRVMVHGKDFVLPIRDSKPGVGFFTTCFVAARDVRSAKNLALKLTADHWQKWGYEKISGSTPTLEVEEVTVLVSRFRFRRGTGYTFYAAKD